MLQPGCASGSYERFGTSHIQFVVDGRAIEQALVTYQRRVGRSLYFKTETKRDDK